MEVNQNLKWRIVRNYDVGRQPDTLNKVAQSGQVFPRKHTISFENDAVG